LNLVLLFHDLCLIYYFLILINNYKKLDKDKKISNNNNMPFWFKPFRSKHLCHLSSSFPLRVRLKRGRCPMKRKLSLTSSTQEGVMMKWTLASSTQRGITDHLMEGISRRISLFHSTMHNKNVARTEHNTTQLTEASTKSTQRSTPPQKKK
jgi:hypothetical protein